MISKSETIGRVAIATQVKARPRQDQQTCFDELLRRYHGQALSTAWRLLGKHHTHAEDAVQCAFEKSWENFEQLENPSRLKSWFFQILVNECRSIQRRHQTRQMLRSIFLPKDSESTTDVMPDHGLQKRITAAMTKLSTRQREAFVLVHLEGFTHQEAAAMMATSQGTLKTHLHRATQTLRLQLRDIKPTKLENI